MNRSPALTIFMVVIGIILLLPGVCALVFMAAAGLQPGPAASFLYSLWAVSFLISIGGAFLLYSALRKSTPPEP
jgi:hypothetical protein